MVLVGVVAVELVLAEGSVAVAFPSAAKVDFVVDAADAVAAAYHEAERIVLAVAGVGNLQLAQDGREEGAWRSQPVDAQGVVASVLQCPLAVVDEAWRQGVQVEVAHAVRADDHGCPLGVERVHHALQGVGRAVEVVAVELHHEASHLRVMHGQVPAAAYAQVVAVGDEVDEGPHRPPVPL